jgi:hypothetical protein
MSQRLDPDGETVSLTIRVAADLHARIKTFADAAGATVAEAGRELLELGLASGQRVGPKPAKPKRRTEKVVPIRRSGAHEVNPIPKGGKRR